MDEEIIIAFPRLIKEVLCDRALNTFYGLGIRGNFNQVFQASFHAFDLPLPINTTRPTPRLLRRLLPRWRTLGFCESGSSGLTPATPATSPLFSFRFSFSSAPPSPYQNPNLFLFFAHFFSCPNLSLDLNFRRSTCFGSKIGDQRALAVGNLNFPLSIVQQMIRFS